MTTTTAIGLIIALCGAGIGLTVGLLALADAVRDLAAAVRGTRTTSERKETR